MATSSKDMRQDHRRQLFKSCPECRRVHPTRVKTTRHRFEDIIKDVVDGEVSFRCRWCDWSTRFFPSPFGAFRAWQIAVIPRKPPIEEGHLRDGKFKNCIHCNKQRSRNVPNYDRRHHVRLIRIKIKHLRVQYKFRCVRCQYTPPGEFFSELEAFVAWNRYLSEG